MSTEIDLAPSIKPRPYKRVNDEITFRDIHLMWRNFEGREGQYNAKGKRNFAIPLDEETAVALHEQGWKIKEKIQDDGTRLYHMPVTVKLDGKKPPSIYLITMSKNRRAKLDEDTAMAVDFAEFDRVDVTLRPFNWDVQGQRGVSAYLKIFMGALHEDELELEYAHIPIEGTDPEELPGLHDDIDAQIDADTGWVVDEEEDIKAIEAAQKALGE